MECSRCHGFMVKDQVYDLLDAVFHTDIWRCVNCGELLDPMIVKVRKNQTMRHAQLSGAKAA